MRRGLPHFELDNAVYFITYRLADSLPKQVIAELIRRQSDTRDYLTRVRNPMEWAQAVADFGRMLDERLDAGFGSCVLRDRRAASIVEQTIRFFDQQRYHLLGWCVMPNHVHVVLQLFKGKDLERVLHSWKSYSSNEINRALGLSGRLWQREYFDRIVRDRREMEAVVSYVLRNPEMAGLRDWPFAGWRDWR
ncbi:MAG TPA: transposase [Thermoanaerobaculia bacterium]|nr:transposase [Thermoanaerobaculia bacterium]